MCCTCQSCLAKRLRLHSLQEVVCQATHSAISHTAIASLLLVVNALAKACRSAGIRLIFEKKLCVFRFCLLNRKSVKNVFLFLSPLDEVKTLKGIP